MSKPEWARLLELLRQREAVPEKLIDHLAKQLRARQPSASARAVAGWLVDHGYLTRFQAQELLKALEQESAPPEPPKPPTAAPAPAQDLLPEPTPKEDDEDLFAQAAAKSSAAAGSAATPILDELEEELGPQTVATSAGSGPWGAWAQGRPKRSAWESPLFLLGGGGLILLIVAGVGLWWAIGRESADQLLQAAEQDYNNGAYTQAIDKFDRFLERFPDHERAGHARVLRGLAIMRRAVDQSTDWEKTLQIVETALKDIRSQEEFPEARPELAALLPQIAEGLTEMAQQKQSAQLLQKARRVHQMILNPNYVPANLRNQTRLLTLEGRFSQIERMLARNKRLSQSLAQIQDAIRRGKTETAYAIRRQLLKEYPELETNAQLQEAIAQATDVERQAIGFESQVEVPQAAPAQDSSPSLPMAHTQGRAVPEARDKVLFLLHAGAVWAVAGVDGRVLWRRWAGEDVWQLPLTLPGENSLPDVVFWNDQTQSLMRLQGTDGKLLWQLPLPSSPDADPVHHQGVIYLVLENRLWLVDAQSGQPQGAYRFPQPLGTPPALSQQWMFLVAEHANVYVLDRQSRECVAALYLGHEPGTVSVVPTVAGPFVLVGENAGQATSLLRVLKFDEKKKRLQLVQSVRLEGQLQRPLELQGRMVVAATDLGGIYLFEVNPQAKAKPLSQVAHRAPVFEQPGPVQVLLDGARLWVADEKLTRFRIQAAEGQMIPDLVLLENASFPQPISKVGTTLLVSFRDEQGAGVGAFDPQRRSSIWITRFATQATQLPPRDPKDPARVVDARGGVYTVGSSLLEKPSSEVLTPAWVAPAEKVFSGLAGPWAALGRGWIGLLDSPARQLPLLSLENQTWQLRWLPLPDALAARPVVWDGHVVACTLSGPVMLLDPWSGESVGSPFFPSAQPEQTFPWLSTLRAPGAQGLLLATERGNLYFFAQKPSPGSALVPQGETHLNASLQGTVIQMASAAWVLDAQGQLWRVELPELKAQAVKLPIPSDKKNSAQATKLLPPGRGKIVWGPVALDAQSVLWADQSGQLICVGKESVRWVVSLSGLRPVGNPLPVDEKNLLLATAAGAILRLDPNSGRVLQSFRSQEPLAGGLSIVGNRLWAISQSGALCGLEVPVQGASRAQDSQHR